MTSGVVLEIQEEKTLRKKYCQGVWIKHGHNVLLKYVHVYNVSVKRGDIIMLVMLLVILLNLGIMVLK